MSDVLTIKKGDLTVTSTEEACRSATDSVNLHIDSRFNTLRSNVMDRASQGRAKIGVTKPEKTRSWGLTSIEKELKSMLTYNDRLSNNRCCVYKTPDGTFNGTGTGMCFPPGEYDLRYFDKHDSRSVRCGSAVNGQLYRLTYPSGDKLDIAAGTFMNMDHMAQEGKKVNARWNAHGDTNFLTVAFK